jgi:hypothetical protein
MTAATAIFSLKFPYVAMGKLSALKFWQNMQTVLWLALNVLPMLSLNNCTNGLHCYSVVCRPTANIIAVFPEAVEKQAEKATKIADEVWVTGKNGTVTQMMFRSKLSQG